MIVDILLFSPLAAYLAADHDLAGICRHSNGSVLEFSVYCGLFAVFLLHCIDQVHFVVTHFVISVVSLLCQRGLSTSLQCVPNQCFISGANYLR